MKFSCNNGFISTVTGLVLASNTQSPSLVLMFTSSGLVLDLMFSSPDPVLVGCFCMDYNTSMCIGMVNNKTRPTRITTGSVILSEVAANLNPWCLAQRFKVRKTGSEGGGERVDRYKRKGDRDRQRRGGQRGGRKQATGNSGGEFWILCIVRSKYRERERKREPFPVLEITSKWRWIQLQRQLVGGGGAAGGGDVPPPCPSGGKTIAVKGQTLPPHPLLFPDRATMNWASRVPSNREP